MLQDKTDGFKAIKISELDSDFKNNVSTQPLQRCSKEGVSEFIAREASSYKCDNIGTIHNSVAKKSVDAELRTERKEIDEGLVFSADISEEHKVLREYSSNVSAEKIKETLITNLSNWVFQTSNANKLVTFYAKDPNAKIEVFINFSEGGDQSHICLGNHFGYISSDALVHLRRDLSSVFEKITEETESKELIWETTNNSVSSKLEKFKLSDPDTWYDVKHSALLDFVTKRESGLEKLIRFFNLESFGHTSIHNMFIDTSLTDNAVDSYLLDCIKIDVKQIYA